MLPGVGREGDQPILFSVYDIDGRLTLFRLICPVADQFIGVGRTCHLSAVLHKPGGKIRYPELRVADRNSVAH